MCYIIIFTLYGNALMKHVVLYTYSYIHCSMLASYVQS